MGNVDRLYVVVPCYNEEEVLPETVRRLTEKLRSLQKRGLIGEGSRMLLVDDGSRDRTWEMIGEYHRENPLVEGLRLSRNRGHQNALLAGLLFGFFTVLSGSLWVTILIHCCYNLLASAVELAGYLPGALLAGSLMVGSYIISVKRNYPKGEPFHIINFLKQLWISIWALLAIIIVVVGVVGGAFTATESAAIAVIYSLIVSVFVYKGVNWKGVWKALDECVNTLAIVMILIATSAVFGDCLTKLHVPDLAAQAIVGITDNKIILILLLNVILLVLGMIMDMAPIILIATPILLPVATQYCGLDPIQFGIMMVLNCGIGLLTPPVGAVLFIGSAVAKRPMEKVVKATLPFYLCMVITLLLVSYWQDVSLIIPKMLDGYQPVVAGLAGVLRP